MTEEVAGKIKDKTNSVIMVDLGNQSGTGENFRASGNEKRKERVKEQPLRCTVSLTGYLAEA